MGSRPALVVADAAALAGVAAGGVALEGEVAPVSGAARGAARASAAAALLALAGHPRKARLCCQLSSQVCMGSYALNNAFDSD